MHDIVFIVIDAFSVLTSLVLVVAAVITAVRCGQKKLAPTAAWILTAGFAIGLVCDFAFAIGNLALAKPLGPTAYNVLLLLVSMLNIAGLIAVAAGLVMFKVKPEVSHA